MGEAQPSPRTLFEAIAVGSSSAQLSRWQRGWLLPHEGYGAHPAGAGPLYLDGEGGYLEPVGAGYLVQVDQVFDVQVLPLPAHPVGCPEAVLQPGLELGHHILEGMIEAPGIYAQDLDPLLCQPEGGLSRGRCEGGWSWGSHRQ